jgi:hypothetical protein
MEIDSGAAGVLYPTFRLLPSPIIAAAVTSFSSVSVIAPTSNPLVEISAIKNRETHPWTCR